MKSLYTIKYICFILAIPAVFFLSSCNEDPDPEPPVVVQMTAEEILTGNSWRLVESEYYSENTNNAFGFSVTAYNTGVLSNSDHVMTFLTGPNQYEVAGDYDLTLSIGYEPNDPNPEVHFFNDVAWEPGTWLLDDDAITFSAQDTTFTMIMSTITETDMTLSLEFFNELYGGLATQDFEGWWRFEAE